MHPRALRERALERGQGVLGGLARATPVSNRNRARKVEEGVNHPNLTKNEEEFFCIALG